MPRHPRAAFALVLGLAIWLSAGCASSAGEAEFATGLGGTRLTLLEPAPQTVPAGDSERVAVVVLRERFRGPVRLELHGLPRGVTAEERDAVIPDGRDVLELTLRAAADAPPVVAHPVEVRAFGPRGLEVRTSFPLTVRARD